MASLSFNSHFLFFFLLFSCIPFISCLSTVSISQTSNSNQTLVCALIHTGNQPYLLNCSSFPRGLEIPVNPNISFSRVVGGDGFLIALRSFSTSNASMFRWRFSDEGTVTQYKRIYQGQDLGDLEAGKSRICGLVNGSNELECWQWHELDGNVSRNFSTIAVGEDFVCGLSQSGNISCLPSSADINRQVPSGNYSVVAAGFRHACAINFSNDLDCWGDGAGVKPQGKFISLALGENRSCALRTNDTVACWGQDNFSLPDRLQATRFVAIEAKRSVFCGVLKSGYSLYCWGNEIFDSDFIVFNQEVVPGECVSESECPCGPLAGSGRFCEQGKSICQHCMSETPTVDNPSPSPSLKPEEGSRRGGLTSRLVAFLVVGCVGSSSLLLVIGFFIFKYCNFRGCRVHDSGRLDENGAPGQQLGSSRRQIPPAQPAPPPVLEKRLSQLASMGNAGHLEEFSLPSLVEATNNFSEDHKIGTGSFGSVYRAILEDGREVAIKRAEISNTSPYAGGTKRQEDKDNAFLNELESLSRLNHKNLVRLLGFCEDYNERVLVYEYMKNGTLHDHLHSLQSSPLMSWVERLKVALDAARGIEYLHVYAVPPIIHRDIKSSNILLDTTWTAKVSDFGLSLMGPQEDESHLSLHAAGTVGYMDPEYYRLQQLTTKSDVYSFGVVLLELLSGYKAIHKNENGVPRNVVDFVVPYIVQDEIHRVLDPKVPPPTPFEIEAVAYVGYLAADCVTLEGPDRPPMTEIVNSLEKALTACLVHPSLSRSTTGSST